MLGGPMPHRPTSFIVAALVALVPQVAHAQAAPPIDRIRLPEGFRIVVVAQVPGSRAMTWGSACTLFVGSTRGTVDVIDLNSLQRIASVSVAYQPGGIDFWRIDK